MLTSIEKGFHAFLLGIMFMLMMSLLEAQIPSDPPSLVTEMEGFAAVLRNLGLAYGLVAAMFVLLGLLSYWGPIGRSSKLVRNNSSLIAFALNLVGFAGVSYFIFWFWAMPC